MFRRLLGVAVLSIVVAVSSYAQEAGVLSFNLEPTLNIPLGPGSPLYTMGAGADLSATYILPPLPFTHLTASLNYNYIPTVIQSSVNTLALGVGGGVNYSVLQNLHLSATLQGGAFAALYNGKYAIAPYFQANAGAIYSIFPSFSLGADVIYKLYIASPNPLFSALGVSVNAVVHLGRQKAPQLKIPSIKIDPVFPILRKYYDDNPLGNVVIRNGEQGTITNVKVSFYARQYMDGPKQSAVVPSLKQNEEKTVALNALFTDSILNITEATKAQVDISVDYTYNNTPLTVKQSETMRILDRNSMTWSDDRETAAFVTSKDPAVLTFSKHVTGLVRDKSAPALDTNLLIAMGLHEALAVYGLQYVPDPTQTWSARFNNKTAVDFLQFPNQTLQYRAGDCDDLSILYNALLESVGIETAFITAPGHIFTAFAVDVKPEELARKFTRPQDFIVQNGKVWVPVEITAVSDSFVRAWDIAAQEWRKYQPTGEVELFTTRDSWGVYEPVGFQAAQYQLTLPAETRVLDRFGAAEQSFVDREIKDRVASLQKSITAAPTSAILKSRLGTLYARYGMLADAEKQYAAAVALKYVPAIVNMGNVQYLKGDFKKALSYYQQALAQRPNNALVLLNAAVASQRLGNNADALNYYNQAKAANPSMALTYQYLESETKPAS